MPKVDGYLTRERILEVSEKLFSEVGYDAASVGSISKMASINKATIYYHFKDKQSILYALYEKMIAEMAQRLTSQKEPVTDIKEKITKEICFLREKKNIISILLMEAMKTNNDDTSLFRIALSEIENEQRRAPGIEHTEQYDMFLLHEFFTGIIPILNYIVLEDKYCAFFNIDKNTALEKFIETVFISHIQSHIR